MTVDDRSLRDRHPVVLVVAHDDATVQQIERTLQAGLRYQVRHCSAPSQLDELFKSSACDLAIVDLEAAGGFECCEAITKAWPQTPICGLAARGSEATHQALAARVAKPIKPSQLRFVLRSLIAPRLGEDPAAALEAEWDTYRKNQRQLIRLWAHDLRGPLVPLRSALAIIAEPTMGADEELVAMAKNATRSLQAIVDNIALLNEAESFAGLPGFETLDVTALLRQQAAELDSVFILNELSLELDLIPDSVWVLGHPVLLESLCRNAFLFAAEHGPMGSTARVKSAQRADLFVVTVEDQGPVVPPELSARLFEPESLPLLREQNIGRGKAMAAAAIKTIAEAHHGTAHTEAPEGGGSCLVICLPVVDTVADEAE